VPDGIPANYTDILIIVDSSSVDTRAEIASKKGAVAFIDPKRDTERLVFERDLLF
jgi:hypothetical protein